MKKFYLGTLILFVLPLVSCAQLTQTGGLILSAKGIINTLIGIVGALALLVFFWGLVKYIANAGDEKAKAQGRNIMVGGVIALFVMFSVWGIIRFLQGELLPPSAPNAPLPPPTVVF